MNAKEEREDELVLELLDAVGKRSDISQRYLARHMGVALGLANSYLKRCVRKGFIKVSEAPANRYLYYLTPKGFAEKSRLTASYLSNSFAFYRRASAACVDAFGRCAQSGWRRILLCGVSDLAEIASLQASKSAVEIVGIYDPGSDLSRYIGQRVWRELDHADVFDACVLTDLANPAASYASLVEALGAERVVVPDILRVS